MGFFDKMMGTKPAAKPKPEAVPAPEEKKPIAKEAPTLKVVEKPAEAGERKAISVVEMYKAGAKDLDSRAEQLADEFINMEEGPMTNEKSPYFEELVLTKQAANAARDLVHDHEQYESIQKEMEGLQDMSQNRELPFKARFQGMIKIGELREQAKAINSERLAKESYYSRLLMSIEIQKKMKEQMKPEAKEETAEVKELRELQESFDAAYKQLETAQRNLQVLQVGAFGKILGMFKSDVKAAKKTVAMLETVTTNLSNQIYERTAKSAAPLGITFGRGEMMATGVKMGGLEVPQVRSSVAGRGAERREAERTERAA
ncbi:hypothetical protein KKC32_04755 [Patescibacteria group bacterium]|nr:hypothetical protein [Patescibacteria group bacterium]